MDMWQIFQPVFIDTVKYVALTISHLRVAFVLMMDPLRLAIPKVCFRTYNLQFRGDLHEPL